MEKKIIRAKKEIWSDSISLYLAINENDITSVATQIIYEERDINLVNSDPVLNLVTTEAQRLMDELWQCGLRPSEGTGSAGSLKATQDHLKDMRDIAFSLLKKNPATAG